MPLMYRNWPLLIGIVLANSLFSQTVTYSIDDHELMIIAESSGVKYEALFNFDTGTAQPIRLNDPLARFKNTITTQIKAGDIWLDYEFNLKPTTVPSLQIEAITNRSTGQGVLLKPEFFYRENLGDDQRITIANSAQNDNPKYLSGTLAFDLQVVEHHYFWDGKALDFEGCNQNSFPKFSLLKKNILPSAIGLFGGLLYGSGLVWDKIEADRLYDRYASQNDKLTADPIFTRANKNFRLAKGMRRSGIYIFSAATAWILLRFHKHHKNKKAHRSICADPRVQLHLQSQGHIIAPSVQIGIPLNR